MRTTTNIMGMSRGACLGIGAVVLVGMFALAALLGYFYFYGNMPRRQTSVAEYPVAEPLTGPDVTIQEPASGSRFAKGTSFPFLASAQDEQGVIRLDLWIDSTLVISQPSPDASGLSPLILNYPLAAVETGTHALIARAYNSQGEFSESLAHYVTVYEPTASMQEYAQYTVQEGDTLESIAAKLGVSVDDILQANPHISSGQVQAGQVVLIPMASKPPAQAALPPQAGGQQQGNQQQGNQQQGNQQQGNQQQGGQLGIARQFLPGQGPFGQLDPNQLPAPKSTEVTPPGGLSVVADKDKCTVTLSWKDSANETAYRIDRYTFGKPNPTTVAGNLAANTTSYQDKVPGPGKHGYRVSAVQDLGGKKSPPVPSAIVWVEVLSSPDCPPLPEFKRIFFQPITFTPKLASLTYGHLRVSIGGSSSDHGLPAIRIPRSYQDYIPTGDWSAVPGISAPAPGSVYTNPNADIEVEAHGDATPNPLTIAPIPLGEFKITHTVPELTDPDSSVNLWTGPGRNFTLLYRIWIEDWLWDGKASSTLLPPPYDLQMDTTTKPGERRLSWSYDKDIQDKEVDGFIVYRSYTCSDGPQPEYPLVAEKGRAGSSSSIAISIDREPTDCQCKFQVSAFGPSGESERSSPQKEACKTKEPVDRIYVWFDSLRIDPSILPKPVSGEIYLYGNALSLRSYAIPLEAKTYDLSDVPFAAKVGRPGLYIPIGGGDSSSVSLNFAVTDLCHGEGVLIRKQGATWRDVTGKHTITAKDDAGNVVCEVVASLDEMGGAISGAPNPVLQAAGDACSQDNECESGECASVMCAPGRKGGDNQFCFANSHCQRGVCDCTMDGKSVPCSPNPNPLSTGFCTSGLPMGASCSNSDSCASDYCANGACAPKNGLGRLRDYCHHNDHCASGRCLCANGSNFLGVCNPTTQSNTNRGYCIPAGVWVNGNTCEKDEDCASGYCAEKKCAPRNDTGLAGEYCHHDDHCYSGNCECQKVMGGGFCVSYQGFTEQTHATCAP
jgi:LysM repeat protein